MPWSIEEMQQALGAAIRWADMPPREGEQSLVHRVVIDSRQVKSGDVFWALPGRSHHGTDFAYDAFMRGAIGIVSDRELEPWPGGFVLGVPDSQLGLWEFTAWHREHFTGTVVAVAGSVGKTTTREMIHCALRDVFAGSRSEKNYNNHIGVPLSLLNVSPRDDFAVLEIAASAAGEIDALSRLCQPHIGVITCVGDAHLAGFGGTDEIVAAKAELPASMMPGGCAVLPGDDARIRALAAQWNLNITWFGRSAECDVAATQVSCINGLLRFRACGHSFCVAVAGRHNLDAALAAIAVAALFGRDLAEVASALADFKPIEMRCEVLQLDGFTVINDCYNSSPLATKTALALLREFGNSGRRIAVLGDMKELGADASDLHYELGQDVVTRCGANRLIACGQHGEAVVRGARRAGMPAHHAVPFADPVDSIELVKTLIKPGDVLLLKGSRALQMENIFEALADRPSSLVA
jgi:UDP-N-acetylmuramoyl-tripeptide--D-alanyl-D-alanine ligase